MKIVNRKAKFNYVLKDRLEAGIVLTGAEVKSIKANKADIQNAYVKMRGDEAYLINANISGQNVKEPTRSRKLLLHKKQIVSLLTKIKAKNLTLVPTKMYNKGRLVKVEIALAKPKKKFQKKKTLKKRAVDREIERALRDKE